MRGAGFAIALSLASVATAHAGNPQADLRVSITDGQTKAVPGQTVTYEIQVYNAGPDAAPASIVGDELVPWFAPVGWTCTAFSGAANDAPYASLVGKAVSVEPSTGFSFDTPLLPRPR